VRIADRRTLRALSVKQDWTVDATNQLSFLYGGELRSERADYDYARTQVMRALVGSTVTVLDSAVIRADLAPSGSRASAYGTVRLQPLSNVTVDVGARADHHTWTQQTTVGPRLNVAWMPSTRTTVRAAWGHYYQAHALQDLSVVDGDTGYFGDSALNAVIR
jgi:outer membrane receptor for ferrienterochelin and colicin